VFPALQGAAPLPELLLSGLPDLMDGYSQGLLGAGAAAAAGGEGPPQALANSLLPAAGGDKSRGWAVGDHTLWWAPLKPLSMFHRKYGLPFMNGSWAGLAPGAYQEVAVTVLVPCGPQQQAEPVLPLVELGMPGGWKVAATAGGDLLCDNRRNIRLHSRPLLQLLEPLCGDHLLVCGHYSQVGLLR
jgi:hypothetical protein